MKRKKTYTDNSFLMDKIALRIHGIKKYGMTDINVLDAFGGSGHIWKRIGADFNVNRTSIDLKKDRLATFHGDNRTIMKKLNLANFNIIDLDAYGVPNEQLEIVFNSDFKGIVFVTCIFSKQCIAPDKILNEFGINKKIARNYHKFLIKPSKDYFLSWLSKKGVKHIFMREFNRKLYFYFYQDKQLPKADYKYSQVNNIANHA